MNFVYACLAINPSESGRSHAYRARMSDLGASEAIAVIASQVYERAHKRRKVGVALALLSGSDEERERHARHARIRASRCGGPRGSRV